MLTIEQICRQLGSDDQVQAYQARRELVVRIGQAGHHGKDADRQQLAAALADQLGAERETKDAQGKATKVPGLPLKARNQVARALADVGGDAEVPALRAALADFELREMARWALSRMTSSAATEALAVAAIESVGNEFRVGVINALGTRDEPQATAALKTCLADVTPEIRLAAVESIAGHADPSCDELIVKVPVSYGRQAKRVAKARLRLAEKLVQTDQKEAAKKIYQSFGAGKYDEALKKAAAAALARLG